MWYSRGMIQVQSIKEQVKKNLVNSKYNNFIKESSQNISINTKRFRSLLRAKTKSKNIPEKSIFRYFVCPYTNRENIPLQQFFFQTNFTLPEDTSHLPQINGLANPNLLLVK